MKAKLIKVILMISVLVMVTGLFSGCGSKNAGEQGANQPAQTEKKEPIKIGFLGALSGANSELGLGSQMAAVLAVEQWNAKGGIDGRPIELIQKDEKYDPNVAVNIVNELISKDKVIAILGPTGSSILKATLPITKAINMPHISYMSSDSKLTQPAIPNVFRFQIPNYIQTAVVAKYASDNFKNIGVLTDTTAYGKPGGDEIEASLAKLGKKVVLRQEMNPKDIDVTAQLLKLKDAKVDGLVIWMLGNDAATVRKGMKAVGLDVPVIGANGLVMKNYRDLAGELVEGTLSTYHQSFLSETMSPEAEQFAKDWHTKYPEDKVFFGTGDKPTHYLGAPAQTYDATNVLLTAIQNAKSTESAPILAALEQISGFKGVNSVVGFSKEDHDAINESDNILTKVTPQGVFRK